MSDATTTPVTVRLSAGELARLDAARGDQTRSAYLRSLLAGGATPVDPYAIGEEVEVEPGLWEAWYINPALGLAYRRWWTGAWCWRAYPPHRVAHREGYAYHPDKAREAALAACRGERDPAAEHAASVAGIESPAAAQRYVGARRPPRRLPRGAA